MPSTITIQSVINYAAIHVELLPLVGVGGFTNEPALSIAQDTISEILSEAFPWKFNRRDLNLFVPQQNRQDHKFAGATAFTLASSSMVGGVGIDLATNSGILVAAGTATVKTLDPHNFSVGDTVYLYGNANAAWDSLFTQTPTLSSWSLGNVITAIPSRTSFQFAATAGQIAAGASGAPGITDFGWAEFAVMNNETENSSPQKVYYLEARKQLQEDSLVGIPDRFCVTDNQNGTVTIRLKCVPGAAPWGMTITYQAKAPLKTSLSDTWTPIPDDKAFMIRAVFLAKAYEYLGSAKWQAEDQKAQAAIGKARRDADAEASHEYIVPDESLMGGAW